MRLLLGLVSMAALVFCSLFCGLCAWGRVSVLLARKPPMRGELVDIGGRRLRVVCQGPRTQRPLVVLESGIYGFAANWSEVQKVLTARGVRSCAYDRAGLGFSDPGPYPRDAVAVVSDLEKLLAARGETGPLVLVGHSMAGVEIQLFAHRNPGRVQGLVLVDADEPQASLTKAERSSFDFYCKVARVTEVAAPLGLMRLAAATAGDRIGLDGPAHGEAVFFWAYSPTVRAAADEACRADMAAAEARSAGPLDPRLPVVAIIEGPAEGPDDPRLEAARRSLHGWSMIITHATHNSILGRAHAAAIADGVDRLMAEVAVAHAPVSSPAPAL